MSTIGKVIKGDKPKLKMAPSGPAASDLNIHLESIQWLMKSLHAEISKLEAQVFTDDLTGLLRRNAYADKANQLLRAAKDGGTNVAVLLVDIDHFKKINDSEGHAEGDVVLRSVAQYLKGYETERNVVGRFGGEEFVLCAEGDENELGGLAEQIRKGIESLGCTVSIGIAHSNTFGYIESILTVEADRALYAAKHAGRNNVKRAA